MYSRHVPGIIPRQLYFHFMPVTARKVHTVGYHRSFGKWGGRGKRIGMWFRAQSVQIVKACTRQFEFVAEQRIRRTMQMFNLYTKIWDEVALREFINSWRMRVGQNAKKFLISTVGVSMYNWDHERISDKELNSYSKEMEIIHRLQESTVMCAKCHLRLVIDVTQPGVKYCTCHDVKSALNSLQDGEVWQPFMEREDMLVWRRIEPDMGGLYAYKVYGSFPEVSAEDFLQVQIDVDYRKEWDPTARHLEILDTDPMSKLINNHYSDVVYWEMVWPVLFTNRDYVFQRRWMLDRERGVIVIVSKGTNHPKAPSRPDTHRVTTYWSYMVIRPYKNFDEPGLEFGLTYFDDPGITIPSTISAWVGMSGLSDFLCRLRKATKDYRERTTIKKEVISKDSTIFKSKSEPDLVFESQNVSKVERKELQIQQKNGEIDEQNQQNEKLKDAAIKNNELEDKENSTKLIPEKDQNFLHYFFMSRLFS